MCIVIDANTFSKVFNTKDSNHSEFESVLDWIENGKGKLVFGGTTYLNEIGSRQRRILLEYKKQGKAVALNRSLVDSEEDAVKKLHTHGDFDDPHMVAIFRVSRCLLFCSGDKRANRFIKNQVKNVDLYSGKAKPPKIYSNKKYGERMLCDRNIATICKACR